VEQNVGGTGQTVSSTAQGRPIARFNNRWKAGGGML